MTANLPGVLAAGVVMQAGFLLADKLGMALLASQGLAGSSGGSPISGVPVAILLGLLLNNTMTLPKALGPGLKFATTTMLRAGIVCVGIKLSCFDIAKLGVAGIPVVVASISAGLLFVPWLNNKMKLPQRMGYLLAAGTSICGVTAIVSLAPAIKATEREVAFAVANVVLFGTLGMLSYPYLSHAILDSSETIGMFLGTAVHDTSQVIGAAMTYKEMYSDDVVLKVAAVTKLTRNLFLAAVIPLLTWLHHKGHEGVKEGSVIGTKLPLSTLVPSFILGFIGMALARTLGDGMLAQDMLALGMFDADTWKSGCNFLANDCGRVLLGSAMAAVGLNINVAVLRGIGFAPFFVGFAGSVVVGTVGFVMAMLLGPYVQLE